MCQTAALALPVLRQSLHMTIMAGVDIRTYAIMCRLHGACGRMWQVFFCLQSCGVVYRRHSGMWECVESLLLPSAFTLAHVFPLATILGEQHDLLLFINHHYNVQHDELLRQEEEEQAEAKAEADRERQATTTAAWGAR